MFLLCVSFFYKLCQIIWEVVALMQPSLFAAASDIRGAMFSMWSVPHMHTWKDKNGKYGVPNCNDNNRRKIIVKLIHNMAI